MNTKDHVALELEMTVGGVVVHGLRYHSSALHRPCSQIGTKSVKVKVPDSRDVSRILVWHPYDGIWFEVNLA